MDILKKCKAKATFFVWGERIRGREKTIKRIKKEGNEIGNHTFSHKRLLFKSKKFIERDLVKLERELEKFKVKTDLFRFPGSKFGINSLIICSKFKKKVIFFDVISNDWMGPPIKKVVKKILKKVKNGSIISFHDYIEGVGPNKKILPILKEIIPLLKKRGYKFVTVSELLNFNSS